MSRRSDDALVWLLLVGIVYLIVAGLLAWGVHASWLVALYGPLGPAFVFGVLGVFVALVGGGK